MLEQYYRMGHAVGVSIQMLAADSVSINVCGVVVNKNKLDLQEKFADLSEIKLLKEKLPQRAHIALGLSGKGVLQKAIDRVDNIDHNNFSQILPNANFDDFYIQHFVSNGKSFVSLIRKTEADKWIALLNDDGFKVFNLSLGAFSVKNIEQQLNVYGEELTFDGHIISRNEQSDWLAYTYHQSAKSSFKLKVESETIDENLVLPYALAFQLVLSAHVLPIVANAERLASDFDRFTTDRKLKVKSGIALCVIFVLLLINFFLLSSLTASNVELTNSLTLSTQSTSNLKLLSEEVEAKEALLKELGWDGGINKSQLIDELAALLPTGVTWNEIVINPSIKTISGGANNSKFDDGKIRVTGKSDQIIPVNEWLARIKTKKWVKNVQLDSYVYDNELNAGRFIILIDF
ncbi:MAG: hypothetical protein V4619_00180 [Bacteroidota bacterium]